MFPKILFCVFAIGFFINSSFGIGLSATTPTTKQCPPNSFESFASSQCYQVFNDTKYFMDAELFCMTLGGHLASIHNAFDNMMISGKARQLVGAEAVIFTGGNNLETPDKWQWMDKTPMNYTDMDYPENDSTNRNCLMIYTVHGRWNYGDCYVPSPYVCQVARV
uniref:C-type lectin domain-containing protein n=1 Tax=Panagrolaimus sp. JU765 TaxID=591449 RepID=A0AC34Q801_9BILA